MMKVSELIDILNQYEPNAIVWVDRQSGIECPALDALRPQDIMDVNISSDPNGGGISLPTGVAFYRSLVIDPEAEGITIPPELPDPPPLSFPVLDYGTDGQPCKVRVLRGDVELGHLVRHQVEGCPDVWASDAQMFFEGGSTFASYCLGDIKDKVRDALRNDHAND